MPADAPMAKTGAKGGAAAEAKAPTASTLLVEIGTEELPPKPLNSLRVSFGEAFAKGLRAAGLAFGEVRAYATPRRLALQVTALADSQPPQQSERRGPAVSAAYDEAGQPTKALLGFARSCGVKEPGLLETLKARLAVGEDLHLGGVQGAGLLASLKTDKGEWLVFRETKAGARLEELLPELLREALAALPVERAMRWGKGREAFVRPVRWLCVLHGGRTLPISLFGLTAGNVSHGHRFMGRGAFKPVQAGGAAARRGGGSSSGFMGQQFKLDKADGYVAACRKRKVLVDFGERKARIAAGLAEAAAACGGKVEEDESLLDEVTGLVEWPVALLGAFDESFLGLPREALTAAMKSHQRYFPLTDGKGRLLPRFITVANLESKDAGTVIAGNERVIRPRLADASFFYAQDTSVRLAERVASLDKVVFQAKLGSYGDKTRRVVELARFIADQLGVDAEKACRAAELCKADLVTDMVGEFPELQGVMGGHYARADGEDNEVATAIAEHYRPTLAGGELPSSRTGACLALADKLDTLVGLFGIGQPPSGSSDPFGLRRLALGVVRICIEMRLRLNIIPCIKEAASLHSFAAEEVVPPVHDYLCERLAHWFGDQGIAADNVEAVKKNRVGINDLALADALVRLLARFRNDPEVARIKAANKRVANLLRKERVDPAAEAQVDPALFATEEERQLHQALVELQGYWLEADDKAERQVPMLEKVAKLHADQNDFLKTVQKMILEDLAGLQSAIDAFFDEVLVMAKDAEVRANRINLLLALRQLFLEVADFSLLQ